MAQRHPVAQRGQWVLVSFVPPVAALPHVPLMPQWALVPTKALMAPRGQVGRVAGQLAENAMKL